MGLSDGNRKMLGEPLSSTLDRGQVGAGQRIKKVAGGTTRIFHYDLQGHLIAETNQGGQMIAEYVYLGDQLLAMIKSGELAYYFHNDHLGTPHVLTNESQNIVWKAAYTPFGEAVPSIQTVENPFRFPGQYYDQETGLHYNYFRYYDPTTGRYVTPDPIGLRGGINFFSYLQNNPVNLIDPRGLSITIPWPTIIKIGEKVAEKAATGAISITAGVAAIVFADWLSATAVNTGEDEWVETRKRLLEKCHEECEHLLNQPGIEGRCNQGTPYRECMKNCMGAYDFGYPGPNSPVSNRK